jgi:uncharacterized protein YqiB (DUF1249 family)
MNAEEKERFIVMENEISHIKKDVTEIKKSNEKNFSELKALLQEHVVISTHEFKCLDEKYASKLVEKIVYALVGTILSVVTLAVIYLVVK